MKPCPPRQDGIAILAMLFVILAVVTATLVTVLPVNERRVQRIQGNATMLEQLSAALVGYALSQPVPGTLPCPDTNGDGLENPQGAGCASQLGLFPYRTLDMDRPADSAGATAWYAVELNYVAGVAVTLNASTGVNLTLDGAPMAAVVIAPGPVMDSQSRTGLTPAEFLEGVNGDADLSDYAHTLDDTGNDQVKGIPTGYYWSLIESLAVQDAATLVAAYRSACGEYPFAANFGGPYDSVVNQQSGAVPFDTALPFDWGTACGGGNAPVPPAWLSTHWRNELHYRLCLAAEGQCITVTGGPVNTAAAVIVAPGVPLAGQNRPSGLLTDYFEAGNSSAPDDQFTYARIRDHGSSFNDTTLAFTP